MTENCLREVDIVVLAGGLGTRLAKTIPDIPKILAPINGKPFLDFILGWLKIYGAQRVILALGHKSQQVEEYVNKICHQDLEIICSVEPLPLGTGGGLAHALPYITTDPVLVMNGDSFVNADLCGFFNFHKHGGAEITLICAKVVNASRYGSVVIDDVGKILSFAEKQKLNAPGAINAGVYLFRKNIIQSIKKYNECSLETEVFQNMAGGSIKAFVGEFEFIDIGTPESYSRSLKYFRSTPRQWVS